MFSTVLSAGKDLANKISNKFLNLSDVEVKVKDATNDDPWGPYGTLMKEIADETYSTMNFNDIMTFLWYRIFMEKPPNNRRTYKGLVLLSYLIVNGSEYVAVSCRDHLHDVRRLESYCDLNNCADVNIRKKASDIVNLLTDPERLSNERKRAKSSQSRFYQSDTGVVKAPISNNCGGNLGNFDEWEPDKKSLPFQIGESFVSFVNVFTQNISGPPPTVHHDNYDIPPDVEFCREVQTGARHLSNLQQARPNNNTNNLNTKTNINSYNNTNNQVKLPDSVASRNITIPNSRPIVSDNNVNSNNNITINAVRNTQNDAPIIDFSEPNIPPSNVIDEFADFKKIEDSDFGDFTSWDTSNTNRNITNVNANSISSQSIPVANQDIFCFNIPTSTNPNLLNSQTNPTNIIQPNLITQTYSQPITQQQSNQLFQADFSNLTKTDTNSTIFPTNSHKPSTNMVTNPGVDSMKVSETWKDIGSLKIDLNNLCGSNTVVNTRSSSTMRS